jgi:hypothetical protein
MAQPGHERIREERKNPRQPTPICYPAWIFYGVFLSLVSLPIIWCLWYLPAGRIASIMWL